MENLQRELSGRLVSGAGQHLATAGAHTTRGTGCPNARILFAPGLPSPELLCAFGNLLSDNFSWL